jgi:hypothetical protein
MHDDSFRHIITSKSYDTLIKIESSPEDHKYKNIGLIKRNNEEILSKSKGSPARIKEKMI